MFQASPVGNSGCLPSKPISSSATELEAMSDKGVGTPLVSLCFKVQPSSDMLAF